MRVKSGDNVILSGYVGKEPEFKTIGSGTLVANFGIKTENTKRLDGTWDSKWDNVSCIGLVAEAARCIHKGDVVLVTGKIKGRTYTAKDGTEKTAVDITVDFFCKMPTGEERLPGGMPKPTEGAEDFTEIGDDGDLPF